MIGTYYTRWLQIGASGCPRNGDRPTDRPVALPGFAIRIVYRHAPPYTLRGVLRIESDDWMLRFIGVSVTHHIVLGSVAELVLEDQP